MTELLTSIIIVHSISTFPVVESYLGHMTASGNAKEFTMANTEKSAVEIEWILDVPVREDIYEYIVSA